MATLVLIMAMTTYSLQTQSLTAEEIKDKIVKNCMLTPEEIRQIYKIDK